MHGLSFALKKWYGGKSSSNSPPLAAHFQYKYYGSKKKKKVMIGHDKPAAEAANSWCAK